LKFNGLLISEILNPVPNKSIFDRKYLSMNLHLFLNYPYHKRMQLVKASGVFLAERNEASFNMKLYHMGLFFAEVWHERQSACLITVIGFEDINSLEPYLEIIDTSEIVENNKQ
jgi:hypothetical protein